MKHAGSQALDSLEPLLDRLRGYPDLKEKARGVFYRRGRAFLHFHEDPTGLFADVRLTDDFERFALRGDADRAALLDRVLQTLG